MLAFEQVEAETNRHGIPLVEATDPANQFRYETRPQPKVDWSERALSNAQKAYYAADSKTNPMDRSGHLWSPPHLKPQ